MSEHNDTTEISDDYFTEHFFIAKEKLEKVMDDLIYQITMRNLAINASDTPAE